MSDINFRNVQVFFAGHKIGPARAMGEYVAWMCKCEDPAPMLGCAIKPMTANTQNAQAAGDCSKSYPATTTSRTSYRNFQIDPLFLPSIDGKLPAIRSDPRRPCPTLSYP